MALVEGGHGGLVGGPALLGVGGSLAQIEQSLLGVGLAGLVEVVGVVGQSHEIDVCFLGQALHVLQSAGQGAGTVGVFAVVGVELAEVQGVAGFTDGEAPALADGLAVGTGNGDGDGDTAVGQIGLGSVGDLAVFVDSSDFHIIDGHDDGGILAHVGQGSADDGTLVVLGLSVCNGGDVGDDRLVLDLDDHGGVDLNILVVKALDGDGQAGACDQISGDGCGVTAVAVGAGQLVLTQPDGQLLHAEQCVDGEVQGVVLTGVGGSQVAEDGLGLIDNAVGDLVGAAGIEVVGEDVTVGDSVHAPGGEGAGVGLEVLHVAAELGAAAAHLVAAVVLLHQPVGILGSLLGVEGVVAGAGGAQVTEGLVVETIVFAVLFDLEDHGAVGAVGHSAFNGSGSHVDIAAVNVGQVAAHAGQNALGGQVVDDDLVTLGGHAGTDHVVIELVDADRLLAAGTVAGENALGVVADGVGSLVNQRSDGSVAAGVDGDGEGCILILAILGAQQVAALGGGVQIAGALAVGGVQGEGALLHAGLQGDDLCELIVADLVVGLDDVGRAAVVGLLVGAHGVPQIAAGDHQDLVAGQQGGSIGDQGGLELAQDGGNIDGVSEGDFLAVIHACLHGLDGEGGILGDGDGAGVLGVLAVVHLIEDGCAFGGTGEGDLGAGVDLACLGGSLGSCHHIGGLDIAADHIEADGVHGLGGVIVCRPAVVVGVPLQVGADGALDEELVGSAIHQDQGPAGGLLAHADVGAVGDEQLLAIGSGEGVGAVIVDADGPDVGIGVAGDGVVGRPHNLGALQVLILFGVNDHIGQGHVVGGVVDHNTVTGSQGVGEAAGDSRTGREELDQEGIDVGVGVGGEVILVILQVQLLAVEGAVDALDIEAVLQSFDLPEAVRSGRSIEGQHIGGVAGGQVGAVGSLEGVVAIVILADGQSDHLVGDGQLVVFHNAVHGSQLGAVGLSGHDLGAAGIVDVDPVACHQLSNHLSHAIIGSGGRSDGLGGIGGHRLGCFGFGDLGLGGLRGDGLLGSYAALDPEADALAGDVAGGVGLVASPVQTLDVDAQVTGVAIGIHDGQVAVLDEGPGGGSVGQTDAVVGGLNGQVLGAVADGIATLSFGDDPAIGASAFGRGHGVAVDGHSGGQRLAAGAFRDGGEDVSVLAAGHGNGDHVGGLDLVKADLRPGNAVGFSRKHRCGNHTGDHCQNQEQRKNAGTQFLHKFSSLFLLLIRPPRHLQRGRT